MKKIFDEEDEKDFQENDKAKILVTIIPFVLIILVLLVTLVLNHTGKSSSEQVQDSIKEYADAGKHLDDYACDCGRKTAHSDAPRNSGRISEASERSRNQKNDLR